MTFYDLNSYYLWPSFRPLSICLLCHSVEIKLSIFSLGLSAFHLHLSVLWMVHYTDLNWFPKCASGYKRERLYCALLIFWKCFFSFTLFKFFLQRIQNCKIVRKTHQIIALCFWDEKGGSFENSWINSGMYLPWICLWSAVESAVH